VICNAEMTGVTFSRDIFTCSSGFLMRVHVGSELERLPATSPERYSPFVRFEIIWMEQCRATTAIKRRFSVNSALD
jgi:hypothetical protein